MISRAADDTVRCRVYRYNVEPVRLWLAKVVLCLSCLFWEVAQGLAYGLFFYPGLFGSDCSVVVEDCPMPLHKNGGMKGLNNLIKRAYRNPRIPFIQPSLQLTYVFEEVVRR